MKKLRITGSQSEGQECKGIIVNVTIPNSKCETVCDGALPQFFFGICDAGLKCCFKLNLGNGTTHT